MKQDGMFVVKFNDGKTDWYFSHFGMWGLPVWVGKSQIEKARRFEYREEARQWIKEFLGTRHIYSVERI